jgi:nicotinamidase-related amidase/type 1 glutamine amidotransferase
LFLLAACGVSILFCGLDRSAVSADANSKGMKLNLRYRQETGPASGRWHTLRQTAEWDAKKTAVVICDMWDKHWCKMSTERVGEMASRVNEFVKSARQRGALVIHCPSDTLDFYKDTPQRKFAQSAPPVEPKSPLQRWCRIDLTKEAPLPIDDTDGGCDTVPQDPNYKAWSRQIATIEVHDGDAITDSAEAYYLMRQRGIENVLVLGVHTNMCVLGRPFSIRQLVQQGLHVVLVRDLTDTMYNPAKSPFVSHFTGTDLVIEHIEKYWCPTITSGDLLDGQEFRFAADKRPHLAIVVSEDEYETNRTLPEFAAKYLGKDFRVTFVFGGADATDNRASAVSQEPSPTNKGQQTTDSKQPNGVLLANLKSQISNLKFEKNDLPGVEVLDHADIALISVRRRTLTATQLEHVRKFVAAGKPMIGIRTASHPFHLRDVAPPDGRSDWKTFDADVWGGHYTNHLGSAKAGPSNMVTIAADAQQHLILLGFPAAEFASDGTLYLTSPLAAGTTVLLTGRFGDQSPEPVAWTFTRKDNGRSFYTSLGHKSDFAQSAFCQLLHNALLWGAHAK